MTRFKGPLMILGAAFFWGVSATLAKSLLNQQIDTLILVQSRVTVAFLLLLLYYGVFKRHLLRLSMRSVWQLALLGVFGVAGANITYYHTIKESTVATAILIQYTAPILVLGYGALRGDDRLTFAKAAAAVVALAGCVLAVGAYDPSVLSLTPSGLMSGVGSILCFAFMTIQTRRVVQECNVWTAVFYAIGFASVLWLVVHPPVWVGDPAIEPATWLALAILALTSILIPNALFFGGLKHIAPSRAIITSTVEPVVAILSAAAVLGERLQPLQVAGAITVVAAIVALQTRSEPMPARGEVADGS